MPSTTPSAARLPRRTRAFRRTLLPLALAVGTVAPFAPAQAAAPSAGTPHTSFSYADLPRLRHVHNVEISPDGRYVAYAVNAFDPEKDSPSDSLWLLRIADRQSTELSPTASSAAWSPDGAQLAFASDDKDGKHTITLASADAPSTRRSFTVPSQAESLVWSPDGRSLALTLFVPDTGKPSFLQQAVDQAAHSLTPPAGAHWAPPLDVTQAARYQADGAADLPVGHTHLFVLSTGTGDLRQLVSGPHNEGSPSWTPDSAHLLFNSNRDPRDPDAIHSPAIFRVDLASGTLTQLTHQTAYLDNPVTSPDGQWITFTCEPARPVNFTTFHICLMHPDGSGVRRLAPTLDRDVFGPAHWAPDSKSFYATFDDRGAARVGHFGLDGSPSIAVSGTDLSFSISRNAEIAYAGDRIDHPAELMLQRPGAPAPIALTNLNSFLDGRTSSRVLHREIPSPADHASIDTWVLLPPGADPGKPLPVILTMHGGPFGFDGTGWSSTYQLFAAAGYAVIISNYRGSTSYGSSFSEPANYTFPGCAYPGLMSVMDALVKEHIADPNRLFVTGGSAGGELTTWIIGKTHRFRAAAAEKPVVNQLSNFLSTDQYLAVRYTGRFPWQHEADFWARSPLSLVDAVSTPTLLLTGEDDRRTPLTETLQFYDALQIRGIPSALIRVPAASHEGLRSRPSQLAAETAAILAWFQHYDTAHP